MSEGGLKDVANTMLPMPSLTGDIDEKTSERKSEESKGHNFLHFTYNGDFDRRGIINYLGKYILRTPFISISIAIIIITIVVVIIIIFLILLFEQLCFGYLKIHPVRLIATSYD